MDPTRAFQMAIDLAETWLANLTKFRIAVDFALESGRPLAPEWAAELVDDVPSSAPVLRYAEGAVRMDIDRVPRALAEGRLLDAVIAAKGWDLNFDRLVAPAVGEGPRDSAVFPPAYRVLPSGIDAINKALGLSVETIGIDPPEWIRYQNLLNSPANPWR